MSIQNSRKRHTTKNSSNIILATEEARRAKDLAGPVEVRQGPVRAIKVMDRTITCTNCWEPLEKGSPFRLRRGLGLYRAHVSCKRSYRGRDVKTVLPDDV